MANAQIHFFFLCSRTYRKLAKICSLCVFYVVSISENKEKGRLLPSSLSVWYFYFFQMEWESAVRSFSYTSFWVTQLSWTVRIAVKCQNANVSIFHFVKLCCYAVAYDQRSCVVLVLVFLSHVSPTAFSPFPIFVWEKQEYDFFFIFGKAVPLIYSLHTWLYLRLVRKL